MKLLKKSLIFTIIFRIYLHFLSLFAIKFFHFKPSFPYWDSVLSKLGPRWLWFWGNFDGVYYLRLAHSGYQDQLTQAFFPLYPILIKITDFMVSNPLVNGLVISHLAFIGFIYFFIKLGDLDYKKSTLWQSLLLLIAFPTSFYFFAIYTESLFLFFATAAFYFSRKKDFPIACLLVGLATATKLVGVFLIPAILWEYYSLHRKDYKKLLKLIPYALISSGGIITYLYFLQRKFNDVLIFISSQPGFGAGRSVDKLTMFYQVVFRYLKMFFLVDFKSDIYPILWLEFIASITFFILIIYALIKKMRPSYLIFIIPTFLLPTLTGTFSSMPRYLLTCFPLFYLLGDLKSKKLRIFLLIVFLLLQVFSFTRFISGQWVA